MTDDEKVKVNERRAVTRDRTSSKRSRRTIMRPSNTDGVSVGRTTNYIPQTTQYNNSSMHGSNIAHVAGIGANQ